MASLLTATGVSKSFGEREILKDISFTVDENSKIGFIGPNGAGKTTLFKLLTGEEDCEGSIITNSLLKVGYMEQTPPEEDAVTAYDYTLKVFSRLMDIEKQLNEIHKKIEEKDGDIDALVKKQDRLNSEYFRGDGMVYKAKTRSMLLGLGFTEQELDYPLAKLSGGQKTRLSLARALLSDANLLLLDEPTNHLDIGAVQFLEDFLKVYNRAFIVISHDRYFLDRVTTSTMELEDCRLISFTGSYSDFVKKREEARKAARRKYENTIAEIKRVEGIIEQQKRWGRERNIRTAESKRKSIDRLEKELEKPSEEEVKLRFHFPRSKRSGSDVLTVSGLSKRYGKKELFKDVSFEIKRGDRVFVLGPNGCGKSTLYGVIKGTVTPDSGEVHRGVNLTEAYYDQGRSDMSGSKTVMDELWDVYPGMIQTEVRNALAMFLFRDDDVFKTVDCLSGGEKARLALLTVLLTGANFLLLDEPTNHLDINAREALEEAIAEYDGTVFIVSHDRYLINKLATKLLVFEGNKVLSYNFNYDQYIEYKKQTEARPPQTPAEPEVKPGQSDYRRQKELQSNIRKLESKIKRLEADVSASEEKISFLNEQINSSGSDFELIMELSEKLKAEEALMEENMTLWEQTSERLEELRE